MRRKAGKALLLLLACVLTFAVFNGILFQKKVNSRPLPSFYKKGVFHLHSTFSDGLGTIEEICRDARRQNLDFVILTDHGRPNRPASVASGWNQETLLIGASEFSLQAGHLAAAGYRVPEYEFPPEAQEAIDEVERDRGMTFIAHPLDRKIPWTDWQVRGFTGIEILSLYQMAKKNILYGLTLFPLQYLLAPDYALTSLISYPKKELEIWDRFNRAGKYYGIYALDSHAKLPLSKSVNFHFPSYEATFKILRVYVKVDHELEKDAVAAGATIIAAMRRGDFFCAIESLAAANGFEFFYLEGDGRRVEMGGDAERAGGSLVLRLPFQFNTDVRIMKDGGEFRVFKDNDRQEITVAVGEPGVYRCEVFLHSGRFSRLPWILANPVFVTRPAPAAGPGEAAAARMILNPAGLYFQVEKNGRSRGEAAVAIAGDGRPLTRFAFTLRKEPAAIDFWTALAHRERLDLSRYRGFIFEARGSRAMRFWLQFRTGKEESSFQHSFRIDKEWRTIAIPFERFHHLAGPAATPDLARVSAFFILIDNGNSFDGAQGELELRPIGLY
ncbi:MAG: CIA30 family protein [Acidobacteriota bacterium]|nr:CIA30 family protein [Acidobacteriota bacterium]